MFEKFLELIPNKRSRNVAYAVGGMGALFTGQKVVALGMFAKGLRGLEECWREAHPHFHGNLADRWQEAIEHYEATHCNPINRKLHVIGIPMIVGGAAGLLLFSPFRPMWFMSAGSFASGWVLNIIGHATYERNAPAFADDPLSFIAGPVWDLKQVRDRKSPNGKTTEEGHVVNVSGEPATA